MSSSQLSRRPPAISKLRATLRRVLDLIEACKIEGDPWAVFAAIEETYAQEWLYRLNRLNRGSDDEGHAANNRDDDERTCD